MSMDIEACVFDAYGTLFDVGAAAARCRDDLGRNADALAEIWRTKQLQYTWLRSLRGDFIDFWHVTGESLDFAMAALGIEDQPLRARLMELYLVLDCYPEVPDMLAALKAGGRRTAILSNGSQTMLTAAVGRAGLDDRLDAVLSVDAVGIFKPHPSTYQMAVDRLGIEAGRIGFVSSNAWDASGAAHFGFRVVWVNRFGQQPDRLPGTPEHEISTLAELPPLLGL